MEEEALGAVAILLKYESVSLELAKRSFPQTTHATTKQPQRILDLGHVANRVSTAGKALKTTERDQTDIKENQRY